jgi:LPPG:FO 2-phospho-L-lactate transferase
MDLLRSPSLSAIIICPSNPFVSIGPILALPGVEAALRASQAPVIAVAPIVAGCAIKGPTARMMAELRMPVTTAGVAAFYGNLLTGYVIDEVDAAQADEVRSLGIEVLVAPTIMHSKADKVELSRRVLAFAAGLSRRT